MIFKDKNIDKIDIILKPLFEKYLKYINDEYKFQIENILAYSHVNSTWENNFYSNILKMDECYTINDYYSNKDNYMDAKLYMMS